FNYEEAHKTFPPAASYDAQGRPLLSWRVTILPYLGEGELGELYNEFRLDEPWDSDHNRKLIARMPSVYADRSEPALAAAGRTTHQVPVGPGTVFDGPQGTKLRDITDGASQTILLVEGTAERAVPWTKPEDWEVDFSDPLRGVRRTAGERQGDGFVIARCDGSAAYLAGIEPEELAAMLTRSGGETVKSGR
ncbi:MAG TPA: DUF1559 domain-containing protein, partial [Lacipirellulaceae bacterium]|nr:DUF1559 domain-containing protein [Lacipirellulaceae bacterium]